MLLSVLHTAGKFKDNVDKGGLGRAWILLYFVKLQFGAVKVAGLRKMKSLAITTIR